MLNKQQVIEFLKKEYEKLQQTEEDLQQDFQQCLEDANDFAEVFYGQDWYLDGDGERTGNDYDVWQEVIKIKIDDQEYLLMWEGYYNSWNGTTFDGDEFQLVKEVKQMVEITTYEPLEQKD